MPIIPHSHKLRQWIRSPFAKADLFAKGKGAVGSLLLSQFLQFIMKRTTQHLRSALALLHDVHTLSKRFDDEAKLRALPRKISVGDGVRLAEATVVADGRRKLQGRRRSLPPPISDQAKTAALQAVAMARIGSFKVRKNIERDRPRAPSTSLDALNLKSPKQRRGRSKLSLLKPVLQQSASLLRRSKSERVAYVFTVEMVHVLDNIQPRELIATKWGTQLKGILHQSDLRIRWICSLLVSEVNPSLRVELLRRLISIAEECHERKNFNAVFEFTVALSSPCVQLLKASWRHIPEKYKAKLQALCALFWNDEMRRDYSAYRSLLANEAACVPVLSILSKDLSITSNLPVCHPKSSKDSALINVRRILRLNEIVLNFSMHISSAYSALESEELKETMRKDIPRETEPRTVRDVVRKEPNKSATHLSAPARMTQSAAGMTTSSSGENGSPSPPATRFYRADENEIGCMFRACVLEGGAQNSGIDSEVGDEGTEPKAQLQLIKRYACPSLPTMEELYAEAKARDLHDNEMLLASLESLGF